MKGSSFVDALRAATFDAHRSLDRSFALDRETLTQERYIAFLRRSLAVVAPLEERLLAWRPAGDVSRVAALRHDLATLGADAADPARVPDLPTRAAAMGAAYVIEGSALGGVFLAKGLAASPFDGALRYLRLRGERTGSHWKAFVAELEAWSTTATDAERADAVALATRVFESYAASYARMGAA